MPWRLAGWLFVINAHICSHGDYGHAFVLGDRMFLTARHRRLAWPRRVHKICVGCDPAITFIHLEIFFLEQTLREKHIMRKRQKFLKINLCNSGVSFRHY